MVLRALCPTRARRAARARRAGRRSGSACGGAVGCRRRPSPRPSLAPEPVDRRREGFAGVAGDLFTSGERVLVAVADVERRRAGLEQIVAGLAPGRHGRARRWARDRRGPGAGARLRPPGRARPAAGRRSPTRCSASGPRAHLAWGPAEAEFALHVWRAELDLRPALAERLPRAARAARRSRPGRARARAAGRRALPARRRRAARRLVRRARASWGWSSSTAEPPACRVLEAERTDLERSPPTAPARSAWRRSSGRWRPSCRAAPPAPPERHRRPPPALNSISCRSCRAATGSRALERRASRRRSGPRPGARPARPPRPPATARPNAKAKAKASDQTVADGSAAAPDRDFEHHPVDEHVGAAPAGPEARLTEDQRVLLGDLFAVVEEHASEAAEQVDRELGRGRVRVRLRAPRRPAPGERRGLHRPPRRRGQDLRRHAARHRDAVRRAAARHRRGHHRVARRRCGRSSARRSPRSSTA